MNADAEGGRTCGKRHRIIERCAARHDRRRAQNTVADTPFDGMVDLCVPPKIVGIQNDLLHVVFLCVFRILCYDNQS